VGGAALLLLVGRWGEKTTLLACAAIVLAASLGAFAESGAGAKADATAVENAEGEPKPDAEAEAVARPSSVRHLLRHMFAPAARPVLLMAMTFKLGLHMAASLLK